MCALAAVQCVRVTALLLQVNDSCTLCAVAVFTTSTLSSEKN